MANLLSRLTHGPQEAQTRYSMQQWISDLTQFTFQGVSYNAGLNLTMEGQPTPSVGHNLAAYARGMYEANGPVFALVAVRMRVFSAVRLAYQRMRSGRPQDLFTTRDLRLLEQPWPGGTTQDLLLQVLLHADLAGQAYVVNDDGRLRVLRPDRVDIAFADTDLGREKAGYVYWPQGRRQGQGVPLALGEVAHFAPYPDPLHPWRGMSWLTPVVREVQADRQATGHLSAFFEHAATPNLAVTLSENLSPEQFQEFVDKFREGHQGVENAYKTLMLGGGADVTVVGTDLEQLNLKDVQGGLETRLAAAAGVPATVVGFREGLQGSSLNAGNYKQARRQFADGTLHPLWQNVAGSFAPVVEVPADARLWYDARDVPFLRVDAKDAAEIEQIKAQTIRALTDAGYDAQSVIDAVVAEDLSQLSHSGLFSVQLQPPDPDGEPQRFTDPQAVRRALQGGWTWPGYRPKTLDHPRIGR